MEDSKKVTVTQSAYGTTANGEKVDRFTLKNTNGMQVDIITYGGRITALSVPDKAGKFENVTLGFDRLDLYEGENPFFGALVGRYGNRIAKAKFNLEGTTYELAANNGPNSLHGGIKGFDKVVWKVIDTSQGQVAQLKIGYLSKDMEEGFPGNLQTVVTYTLTADNILKVDYEATTDKTTIVNLTQHAYFNLSGDLSKDITDHVLEINADRLVPVDDNLIPTGELAPVSGTPFDFTSPKPIGQDIGADNEQIKKGGGYDHCWVLNDQGQGLRQAAILWHPASGRVLEVATSEPGMQLYTGNFLDGSLPIPGGGTYQKRSGLCLETQHYPDTPNQPSFPSVTLRPGSEHVVGLAGAGASDKLPMLIYEIHAWIVLILGWVFLPFYARSGVFTMPEFLEKRFDARSRWVLSVFSIVAYVLTKISVTIYAGGVVVSALMGIDFWTGAIATVVLTGLYTVLGGVIALTLKMRGELHWDSPDEAFPVLMSNLLPSGLRGLVAAGLLAALMSSLASVFNSCSTLFTVDIYKKLRPGTPEKKLVRTGQIAT
ncbi:unnamed protein product, partial [Cyprideis torosa]